MTRKPAHPIFNDRIKNYWEISIKGIVCRIESKDYYVLLDSTDEIIRCSLKGKFKKDFHLKKDKLYQRDISVVGDYVEFDLNEDGTGVIYSIKERKNYLSRKAPKIRGASYRGERLEQIIAANIDNLFVVGSIKEPMFNNKVIDRLLVMGESAHLKVYIIINKTDLGKEDIKYWAELYKNIGYHVYLVSALNKEGLKEIYAQSEDRKNLFLGHSGVGKSSLINVLFPGLNLRVGEISSFTDKGTHTTVTGTMINVGKNTFVIDTPGIREIEPYGIKKEDLGHYFSEFSRFINDCKFNTCTHFHEPGCAVINAVENGHISLERYESYLRMLETVEEDIIFQ